MVIDVYAWYIKIIAGTLDGRKLNDAYKQPKVIKSKEEEDDLLAKPDSKSSKGLSQIDLTL